jgi:hypothetical protein
MQLRSALHLLVVPSGRLAENHDTRVHPDSDDSELTDFALRHRQRPGLAASGKVFGTVHEARATLPAPASCLGPVRRLWIQSQVSQDFPLSQPPDDDCGGLQFASAAARAAVHIEVKSWPDVLHPSAAPGSFTAAKSRHRMSRPGWDPPVDCEWRTTEISLKRPVPR